MASGVYSVKELLGRTHRFTEDGVRTYQRVFQVLTTTPIDGQLAISQVSGIPRMYDPYVTSTEYDLAARVVSVDPRETQDPGRWEVFVDYSSRLSFPEQAALSAPSVPHDGTPIPSGGITPDLEPYQSNPLLRETEMSWDFEKYQHAVDQDLAGNPVANSAGTKFPITIPRAIFVCTITRNEAGFDPNNGIAYQDLVNTDVWFGFPAGKCRIDRISARSRHEENLFFWRVTYVVHIKHDGWRLSILDEGTHERYPGNVYRPIIDDAGRPVSEPVPLDGTGFKLASGADPVFLEFQVYREGAFGPLNIP